MTDLDRPGSSSRYTWTDDDDTEVPAEGASAEAVSAQPDDYDADLAAATGHDLNVEVAAIEEAELRERLRRERAEALAKGEVAPSLAWDDDEVSDRHADSFDVEDDHDVAGDRRDDAPEAGAPEGSPPGTSGTDDGGTARRDSVRAAAAAADMAPHTPAPATADEATGRPAPDSGVVYVFEPNNREIPPVREYVSELWARRKFMVELARSESRGSRSSTVLGELWAVIDPLFQVALYWFLLTIIRQGKGARGAESLSELLVLMVGGIFLFTLSTTTITAGGRSILSAKNLMLNSTFPRALLPLSAAYKAVTEFIPTIFIYLVFHFAFGQSFGLGFFVLPLLLVIQMVMSTGIALVFATFTVFLRDTTNILGYIMRVLFFATPVIYPATSIPDGIRPFLQANPFFALFSSYQAIISGGSPNPIDVVVSAAWATLFIVLGYRLFAANERSFALRL